MAYQPPLSSSSNFYGSTKPSYKDENPLLFFGDEKPKNKT